MGLFNHLTLSPPDSIFGIKTAFLADPRKTKVNLILGVFKTEDLLTPVLKCVKKAEQLIVDQERNKEYLPIDGDKTYLSLVGALIFGEKFWKQNSSRIAAVQTVGGTGALRTGGDFLKQEVGEFIHYSDPTWANHIAVMFRAGLKGNSYPYYDVKKHKLEFDQFYAFCQKFEPGNIILLHACCHNPTGADPTIEQWKKLSTLFLERKLIPFFDFAYQGFGDGLDKDATAIRLFAEAGHEMIVANSFSKNFALYAERVGTLYVVAESEESAKKVLSKLKVITRTSISNPPLHGERIVSLILGSPELKKDWEDELSVMRTRINTMRDHLTNALCSKSKKIDFSFLKDRHGLFCFCGLAKAQVERLVADFGIYMTQDGRINVTGLNHHNLEYVVDAIVKVSES